MCEKSHVLLLYEDNINYEHSVIYFNLAEITLTFSLTNCSVCQIIIVIITKSKKKNEIIVGIYVFS